MVENNRFLHPDKFRQISSVVADDRSKLSQTVRDQGCHLSLQNTHLIKDVEYLLYIRLRQIPFSGCRGELKSSLSQAMKGGHI